MRSRGSATVRWFVMVETTGPEPADLTEEALVGGGAEGDVTVGTFGLVVGLDH